MTCLTSSVVRNSSENRPVRRELKFSISEHTLRPHVTSQSEIMEYLPTF